MPSLPLRPACIAAAFACTTVLAGPARPDPLDARVGVPPVVHRSAFEGYRPAGDLPLADWRASNDTVGRIGGWRAYAREAAAPRPGGEPSGPHEPAQPPHDPQHQHQEQEQKQKQQHQHQQHEHPQHQHQQHEQHEQQPQHEPHQQHQHQQQPQQQQQQQQQQRQRQHEHQLQPQAQHAHPPASSPAAGAAAAPSGAPR